VRAASGRSDAGEEKADRAGAMRGWGHPGRWWDIYRPTRAPPHGYGRESSVHHGPGARWLVFSGGGLSFSFSGFFVFFFLLHFWHVPEVVRRVPHEETRDVCQVSLELLVRIGFHNCAPPKQLCS
jgi:hypothetical protein